MTTGNRKQGSGSKGQNGNGMTEGVDLRREVYTALYAPYAQGRERLLGWGFNLVNDFNFPAAYHNRYLEQKFGREFSQVAAMLRQLETTIRDAAMVLGVVLWLSREYPQTYCKALLREDETFVQWLREKVRLLEDQGIAVLYLK